MCEGTLESAVMGLHPSCAIHRGDLVEATPLSCLPTYKISITSPRLLVVKPQIMHEKVFYKLLSIVQE